MSKKSQIVAPSVKASFVEKNTFFNRLITFQNLLILAIIASAILTFSAKSYPYFAFDLPVTKFIQAVDILGFDFLMRTITFIGNIEMVIIVTLFASSALFYIRKFKAGVMVIISSFLVQILSITLKYLVGRPRPVESDFVRVIGEVQKTDSFPSGHVLSALGLYGFLLFLTYTQLRHRFLLYKIITIILLTPILLMGISRIYLGAHWFSDVLGAYLIGYIWLFIMVQIYNLLNPRIKPQVD